jgi:hypothetical protein
MLEYRERNKKKAPAQTRAVDAADPGTEKLEKYWSIAAKYGLGEEMGMGVDESGGNEQTIDQEYQAYITGTTLRRNVNILNFWEVGDLLMTFQYYSWSIAG